MVVGSQAHDDPTEGGSGSSPPPSPSSSVQVSVVEPTASIITVSSADTECSNGKDGELTVRAMEVQAGEKWEAGVSGTTERGPASVVVDLSSYSSEDPVQSDAEKFCRICHLSPDRQGRSEGSELIQLGCGCKGDLATAHRRCAEAWFALRRNRYCEICSVKLQNINGNGDARFMEEWQEGRILAGSSNRNLSERDGCWRRQPFCNFLMAFLVICFVLSWFFRVDIF